MVVTIADVIVWLILGALAGTLVGATVKGTKHGFGIWKNLGVGLLGALVGGLVFRLLKIDFGLGQIAVTANDVLAALLGSFAVLGVIAGVRRKRPKPPSA